MPSTLVSRKIKINEFASGLDHPEGLAFDREGNLWAGGELGQVYRISEEGTKVEIITQLNGFCLGMAFSPDGDLFICNHKIPAVVRFDPRSVKHEIFAERVGQHRIRVPNYPVFDSLGNLFISDSGDWNRNNGKIFRFDARGGSALFATGLSFANGLALDATGENLYVVQSSADNILRIPIGPDGQAGRASIYARDLYSVPDGLAFDCQENLYVCCYANSRIYKIAQNGNKQILCEDTQAIHLNRPTNLAFGGPNFDHLFATNLGAYHISSIKVGVRGQKLASGYSSQARNGRSRSIKRSASSSES